MRTNMVDDLYKLMTWLSPSFPVGAYSFSHGLENAVETGFVTDATTAEDWIRELVLFGDGQADLVFLNAAWQAASDRQKISEVHEHALAFQPTAEIVTESTAQGTAFLGAAAAAWPCPHIEVLQQITSGPVAYPVALGVVARDHNVAIEATLHAYGHAFIANLVSAAIRLIPLGQTDGQKMTAALKDAVAIAVERAAETPLASITSSCVMADITSMRHEVQYTRLFRS